MSKKMTSAVTESSEKRAYCPQCQYPSLTCICASISPQDCAIDLSIMQDPSESKHAKNTARIIPLILHSAKIYVGETQEDFTELQQKLALSQDTIVIYPAPKAIDLTEIQAAKTNIRHLILLDGSWRKAKKMWLNNPWLHNLPCVTIRQNETSQYHIRKRPFAESLSTLEATAFTLKALKACSDKPFIDALNALQDHWINARLAHKN